MFFLNANTKDYITLEQEERYYLVKSNLNDIRNKILNRKRLFNVILGAAYGVSLAIISLVLAALLLVLIKPAQFEAAYSKVYVKLLVLFVPLLLGALIGLMRKKNKFLVFLSSIIIIGFVIGMIMVM